MLYAFCPLVTQNVFTAVLVPIKPKVNKTGGKLKYTVYYGIYSMYVDIILRPFGYSVLSDLLALPCSPCIIIYLYLVYCFTFFVNGGLLLNSKLMFCCFMFSL